MSADLQDLQFNSLYIRYNYRTVLEVQRIFQSESRSVLLVCKSCITGISRHDICHYINFSMYCICSATYT